MQKKPKRSAESASRKPPVKIPLPFDKAVEGLLGVKPKKDGAKNPDQK
jgi:hypothetical protein